MFCFLPFNTLGTTTFLHILHFSFIMKFIKRKVTTICKPEKNPWYQFIHEQPSNKANTQLLIQLLVKEKLQQHVNSRNVNLIEINLDIDLYESFQQSEISSTNGLLHLVCCPVYVNTGLSNSYTKQHTNGHIPLIEHTSPLSH